MIRENNPMLFVHLQAVIRGKNAESFEESHFNVLSDVHTSSLFPEFRDNVVNYLANKIGV